MSAPILITGASGFVGRALLPALSAGLPDMTQQGFAGDITDPAAIRAAIIETEPAIVIHLAAIAAVPQARNNLTHCFEVNLTGTLHLAEAIIAHAPQARLIYFGSGDCYGASFQSGAPASEATLLAPLNSYAASKAAADLALGALAAERGLRCLRLRPFNQIGPTMPENYALGSFAAQLKRIRAGAAPPELRVGNLDAERDMLHVGDVANAVMRAITLSRADRLAENLVLNLASGQPRRIGAVLDDLITRSGLPVTITQDPTRLRPSDIPRAVGDASAAQRIFGWTPTIPYSQWLDDLLAP